MRNDLQARILAHMPWPIQSVGSRFAVALTWLGKARLLALPNRISSSKPLSLVQSQKRSSVSRLGSLRPSAPWPSDLGSGDGEAEGLGRGPMTMAALEIGER